MEGSNIRRYPRTQFRCAIELLVGKKSTRLDNAVGNLSVDGLFLEAATLPSNTALHVKIGAVPPFEADGVVRFSGADGVGIEFTGLTDNQHRRLDDLIAQFLPREVLARAAKAGRRSA